MNEEKGYLMNNDQLELLQRNGKIITDGSTITFSPGVSGTFRPVAYVVDAAKNDVRYRDAVEIQIANLPNEFLRHVAKM